MPYKGSRVMVASKSYSIKEVTVFKYCGRYLHEPVNRKSQQDKQPFNQKERISPPNREL